MAGLNGLRALFSGKQAVNVFNQFQDKIQSEELLKLQYIGEDFVNKARTVRTYVDDTANLRSSIGYIILLDGKIIDQSFAKAGDGSDGDTGRLVGMDVASEVASNYSKGYVLIGVAGMNYAASVEAHGYDVITGSAPEVEFLKSIFNEVKF